MVVVDDLQGDLVCHCLSRRALADGPLWTATLPEEFHDVHSLHADAEGTRLAVIGSSLRQGLLGSWDRQTDRWVTIPLPRGTESRSRVWPSLPSATGASVSVSRDASTMVLVERTGGGDKGQWVPRAVSLPDGREVRRLDEAGAICARYVVSDDGAHYARIGREMLVGRVRTEQVVPVTEPIRQVESAAFDAATPVAAVAGDEKIVLVDLRTGRVLVRFRPDSPVTDMRFVDGRLLVSHHANATALVWPLLVAAATAEE
jgi:hypothetical protein